jgi:hypothetical protein
VLITREETLAISVAPLLPDTVLLAQLWHRLS